MEKERDWEKRLEYNSHDMGETGMFIRLDYAKNILRETRQEAVDQAIDYIISRCAEGDLRPSEAVAKVITAARRLEG